MTIHNYEGKKFDDSEELLVNDNLTVEQALQININNEPFTITMRTPGHDDDLVRGLLYVEDVYRNKKNLKLSFFEDQHNNMTKVNIMLNKDLLGNGYLNSRNLLSVASCGICGKTALENSSNGEKLEDDYIISSKDLRFLFSIMKNQQPTFLQSGGSHAAAVFTKNKELLSIREDIGRHNAVDKVIGHLVNTKQLSKAKILLTSGRVSYEIVSKTFAAKIPLLAAVSAPSSLAVDFAKELGITLLGFCRNNKATCYAHPYRIS